MKDSNLITGHYAKESGEKGRNYSQVHLFFNTGKALCGYKTKSKKMKLQWNVMYPYLDYVECEQCKKIFKRNMLKLNLK